MDLLTKVKELCRKNGISVHKVEIDLGFGNRAIYKWDSTSPSIDKVKAVADYFGVSVDYLLSSEEQDQTDLQIALQKAFDNRPEMRMLFSVAEDATAADIEQAVKIIEALKK